MLCIYHVYLKNFYWIETGEKKFFDLIIDLIFMSKDDNKFLTYS